MIIEVIEEYFDLGTGEMKHPGDLFEVGEERAKVLLNTQFCRMAEQQPAPEPQPKRKTTKTKK